MNGYNTYTLAQNFQNIISTCNMKILVSCFMSCFQTKSSKSGAYFTLAGHLSSGLLPTLSSVTTMARATTLDSRGLRFLGAF